MSRRVQLLFRRLDTVGTYGRSPIVIRRKTISIYPRFTFIYGDRDGAPILKGEPTLPNVTGLLVRVRTWQVQVQFRRFSQR